MKAPGDFSYTERDNKSQLPDWTDFTMKLLRYGEAGSEKPGLLDHQGSMAASLAMLAGASELASISSIIAERSRIDP